MRYAILCLVLFAMPVRADAIAIGTLNSDGYSYQGNGLWQWSDGSLWQRSYVDPYYYAGRYYSGYYKYSYFSTGAYPKPTSQSGPQIIAKAVAARDAVRSEIINRATDYQSFIEAMKAAKLDHDLGPMPGLPNYGSPGPHSNSLLYGTFGVNTSTVYGYNQSLAQTIDPFKPNLDQYFLQAFQLADGAQTAAKEANSNFNSTVNNAASQAAALSGIAARRDAIVAFSKLLDGPPATTSSSALFKLEGGKVLPVEVLPSPKAFAPGSLQDRWNASAQKCAACHSGNKLEGGFDLAKFGTMTGPEADNVLARLDLPANDPRHMPKGGPEFSTEEKLTWHQAAAEARKAKLPSNRQELPRLK